MVISNESVQIYELVNVGEKSIKSSNDNETELKNIDFTVATNGALSPENTIRSAFAVFKTKLLLFHKYGLHLEENSENLETINTQVL